MIEVHLKSKPFPHCIIENFYDEEELTLIWKELDFLTNSNILIKSGNELGTAKDSITRIIKSSSFGLNIEDVYKCKSYSNLSRISDSKVFNPDLLESIANIHPLMRHLAHVNYSNDKIKYYEDTQYYKPHIDTARFTCLNYFYKEPKQFKGGDLKFHEFDYTIEIKNNMAVIFCGAIEHESTQLDTYNMLNSYSGFGKYCLTKFLGITENAN